MVLKLFLLLSVLQFTAVYIYADVNETVMNVNHTCPNVADCVASNISNEQKIQHEIFTRMCLTIKDLFNTSTNTGNENIQFFPILETIRDNMILIEIYHENGLAPFYPKHEFLQVPYELADLLDELEQSPHTTVKFKKAIFFNEKVNREYLKDMLKYVRNYYHSNTSENRNNTSETLLDRWISENTRGRYLQDPDFFRSESSTPKQESQKDADTIYKSSLLSWMSKNTRGRTIEKEDLWTPGLTNFTAILLEYSACWHTFNVTEKEVVSGDILFERTLLYKPTEIPTSKFEDAKIYVKAFSRARTQKMGYYNNLLKGYEAIKVPYKSSNFSMAVILPYRNQSLEIFLNFTPEDYLELLNGISLKEEYIEYVIPVLNISMVTINENGTRINSDEPVSCASSQPNPEKTPAQVDFKNFVVDKPFGVIIFHERTKFVLWQALIRNPRSQFYVSRRPLSHENARGVELERKFIF